VAIKKIMYWRNTKLKIVIGLVIFCLLLYIFLPIIIKAAKRDKSDDQPKPEENKES